MSEPVEAWIDAITAAERRGEPLAAFDLAERGLEAHATNIWLQHRAVLALARAGSTLEAERRFVAYGLADVDDEDVQALGARIAKDVALATSGPGRSAAAARAGDLYQAIYDRTGGYYPGVNAATMMLVCGSTRDARMMAEEVLAGLEREDAESYYVAATQAESLLVLGRADDARHALARAAALNAGDHSARATTRRQLRLVCEISGVDDELLSEIAGPSVVHYCGHRIQAADGSRFSASDEKLVATRIAKVLDRDAPGFAYGSLASGADIMWAEALIERGAEVHVVLPFATDEFIGTSVADSGAAWVDRFHSCLGAATTTIHATDDAYLNDNVLYQYASELAMGLALLRARFLDSSVRQLAVWDASPTSSISGTAADVATWTLHGHPLTVVAAGGGQTASEVGGEASAAASGRVIQRVDLRRCEGFFEADRRAAPALCRTRARDTR